MTEAKNELKLKIKEIIEILKAEKNSAAGLADYTKKEADYRLEQISVQLELFQRETVNQILKAEEEEEKTNANEANNTKFSFSKLVNDEALVEGLRQAIIDFAKDHVIKGNFESFKSTKNKKSAYHNCLQQLTNIFFIINENDFGNILLETITEVLKKRKEEQDLYKISKRVDEYVVGLFYALLPISVMFLLFLSGVLGWGAFVGITAVFFLVTFSCTYIASKIHSSQAAKDAAKDITEEISHAFKDLEVNLNLTNSVSLTEKLNKLSELKDDHLSLCYDSKREIYLKALDFTTQQMFEYVSKETEDKITSISGNKKLIDLFYDFSLKYILAGQNIDPQEMRSHFKLLMRWADILEKINKDEGESLRFAIMKSIHILNISSPQQGIDVGLFFGGFTGFIGGLFLLAILPLPLVFVLPLLIPLLMITCISSFIGGAAGWGIMKLRCFYLSPTSQINSFFDRSNQGIDRSSYDDMMREMEMGTKELIIESLQTLPLPSPSNLTNPKKDTQSLRTQFFHKIKKEPPPSSPAPHVKPTSLTSIPVA